MINIISTQAKRAEISGPQKVFLNLVKGLEKIGYPYVINRDLNSTNRLWIHDDIFALKKMHHSKAKKIVGPNLFVMPKDIPQNISFDGVLYLQPCNWAVNMWKRANFASCPLAAWPVGIDTDVFYPSDLPLSKRKVLVYHKMRDIQELPPVFDILHEMHLNYSLVLYGEYLEEEYKRQLDETSFIIWHGIAESQGIAFQEALACDIPILVWDVTSVSQTRGGYPFEPWTFQVPVTAAPYFDDSCGIKIYNSGQLRESIETMLDNYKFYLPREYILKNLSLENQAKRFVKLWDHWNLTYESGLDDLPSNSHLWKGQSNLSKMTEKIIKKVKRENNTSIKRGSNE